MFKIDDEIVCIDNSEIPSWMNNLELYKKYKIKHMSVNGIFLYDTPHGYLHARFITIKEFRLRKLNSILNSILND